ncbi:MAG TPA: tetratricopeptide repeat protein [Rhizomicrobium sp.]|jgi:localization factor PodJL|nr:tetratricopeptide repeat protein [Rhizomicrobium sp.]
MENEQHDLRRPQLERIASPSAEAAAPSQDSVPGAVDAWLERRLRVFERALAQLETRQEKSEQGLSRRIALLEEKIAAYEHGETAQPPAPEPPPVSLKEAVPESEAPAIAMAAAPLAQSPIEPALQKQIGDFLADARRAAKEAAVPVPPSSKPKGSPRWMAWAAVGCAAMTVTALALGSRAGASEPVGAVSHSQAAQAFGHVIALADSGDPRDQTVVAFAYLRGEHLVSDHKAAGRWALAAAERGDPMAQYLIGAFYQAGDGVAADPRQAVRWFQASALRGNLKAMHNLAIAYAQGQGIDRNPERAAAWFNRAAEQGYADSQFDLAVLYERGDGVKQNPGNALKWYLIAARGGDKEAGVRAIELKQAMSAFDIAQAEALAAGFTPMAHDQMANNL